MTPTIAPARPQHLAALDNANEIRIAMAAVLREIRAMSPRDGLLRAAEILEDPDETASRIELRRLLKSIKRMGPARIQSVVVPFAHVAVITRRLGPWEDPPTGVRVMTAAQRECIAGALRGLAEGAQA